MSDLKIESEFEDLISTIKVYLSGEEVSLVIKAWKYAVKQHAGQRRKSGDLFITHPLEVAKILASWRLDVTSLAAGILHDVVEDTSATNEDIAKEFGEEVSQIIKGVTKIADIKLMKTKGDLNVENFRKLLLVMAKDLRVVLVKLADRLHNMQTLSALSPEKQIENSQETLDIYAPMAERLGIGEVKGELQDLAFPYLYKEEYERVVSLSKAEYKKAGEHIKKMTQNLYKNITKQKINAQIHSRKKHLFSLWKKLEREGIDWDFSRVYDIVAMRILVNTKEECYQVLGIVHEHYRPSPNHPLSDYIAQPKPNGYQSLHTKVFGPGMRIVEVQIRTHQMHGQAEYGIAAHWMYGEAKALNKKSDEELDKSGTFAPTKKLNWIKELVRWQEELDDSKKFMEVVKFDALNHRIFVFSPRGDIYDLPAGATPIDFAAYVHTDLVKLIKGVKVNGTMAPLNKELKSGDVVEIIKSKNQIVPGKNWMEFAKTAYAKREIGKVLLK